MTTIVGGAVAAKALGWCRTQRVVVTGLWNSNGLQSGQGLIEAIQQSFVSDGIKLFAAGPVTLSSTNPATNADSGNSSGRANTSCVGWQRVVTGSGANSLLAAANVQALHSVEARAYTYGRGNDGAAVQYPNLYRMLHFQNVQAVGYGGVASGISFPAVATSPFHIDPTAALRTDHHYSNATAAGGTFRPAAITGAVPNVHVANNGSNVVVSAGTPTGFSRVTWDVPAGARDTQLRVGPSAGIASPADCRPSGEVGFGFQVTWERDALTGVLVAPFLSMGGWSTRDFAENLTRSDGDQCYAEAIDHWLDVTLRPTIDAGQTPRMIFVINEGSNETSESGVSIPGGHAGGSLSAWKDNVATIIAAWRARWAAKGYAPDDFVVALVPDHPNRTAGETARASYAQTGVADLIAAEPSRTFGINSLGRWTVAALSNAGVGAETLYDRAATAQSITNIGINFVGGDVACNIVNSYTASDLLRVTGTNSTPAIDGTWSIASRTGTTVNLATADPNFEVTGAGNAGSSRTIDSLHLAVSGTRGATTNGYRTYWSGLFDEWSKAGPDRTSTIGLGIAIGL